MGPRSPWARLRALDARVVLLGVGFERCSILHHAERLAEPAYLAACAYSTFVRVDGERRWFEVESGAGCSDGFGVVEPKLRAAAAVEDVTIGDAHACVVSASRLVSTALSLLTRDPAALLCSSTDCAACNFARSTLLGHRARGLA